jgi:hypothetical protein
MIAILNLNLDAVEGGCDPSDHKAGKNPSEKEAADADSESEDCHVSKLRG